MSIWYCDGVRISYMVLKAASHGSLTNPQPQPHSATKPRCNVRTQVTVGCGVGNYLSGLVFVGYYNITVSCDRNGKQW